MQNYHLRINYRRLFILMLVIFGLSLVSFFIVAAAEENGASDGIFASNGILVQSAKLICTVTIYPTRLCIRYPPLQHFWTFIIAAIVGIMLDSIIIELLFALFFGRKIPIQGQHK